LDHHQYQRAHAHRLDHYAHLLQEKPPLLMGLVVDTHQHFAEHRRYNVVPFVLPADVEEQSRIRGCLVAVYDRPWRVFFLLQQQPGLLALQLQAVGDLCPSTLVACT
jgi:hypothetical protein